MYAPHRYLFPPFAPFRRRKTPPRQSLDVKAMESVSFMHPQVIPSAPITHLAEGELIELIAYASCLSCKGNAISKVVTARQRRGSIPIDVLSINAATPSTKPVPAWISFWKLDAARDPRTLTDVMAASGLMEEPATVVNVTTEASMGGNGVASR